MHVSHRVYCAVPNILSWFSHVGARLCIVSSNEITGQIMPDGFPGTYSAPIGQSASYPTNSNIFTLWEVLDSVLGNYSHRWIIRLWNWYCQCIRHFNIITSKYINWKRIKMYITFFLSVWRQTYSVFLSKSNLVVKFIYFSFHLLTCYWFYSIKLVSWVKRRGSALSSKSQINCSSTHPYYHE